MQSQIKLHLSPEATSFLDGAIERVRGEGIRAVQETLPALARRVGRGPVDGGIVERSVGSGRPARIDLGEWRTCDVAGWELLLAASPSDDDLIDLYLHGDLEERIILLRAVSALPLTDGSIRLLEEVQRTNMESHFRAAICGSNLAVRALDHAKFGEAEFNRLLLKAAFLGLPLRELIDATDGANPELSRMLQDLATEREAAGRGIWPDTARMIAHAPCAGSIARLIGGLEHGDDKLRLAAAEGIALLNRPDLALHAKERLPREPRAEIRAILEKCG